MAENRRGDGNGKAGAPDLWIARLAECRKYLEGVVGSVESGRSMRVGPSTPPLIAPSAAVPYPSPAKVLYCSPHPDDESLNGALPLRLRLEGGAEITDVAITLGSDIGQRARRRQELEAACRVLGFKLVIPGDPGPGDGDSVAGFNAVTLKTHKDDPQAWAAKVQVLAAIFDQERPDAVLVPHAEDFNTTHVGTHALVVDALGEHLARTGRDPVTIIETEFWHQLAEPNLMVGVALETVAIMLAAQMEHGGEMSRNPYHLLAPARMMDNIRRGSEVVGGQGAAAQKYSFAELHRVVFMRGRELVRPQPGGLLVGPGQRIDLSLLHARFWPI